MLQKKSEVLYRKKEIWCRKYEILCCSNMINITYCVEQVINIMKKNNKYSRGKYEMLCRKNI